MNAMLMFNLKVDDTGEITNIAEKELYEEAIVNIKGTTPLLYHIGYECTIGKINGEQFYILETLENDDSNEITLNIFSEEKEFIDIVKSLTPLKNKDFHKGVLSNYVSEEALDNYV
ncbi:hypothetical protein D3C76_01740 [compost metagenome]